MSASPIWSSARRKLIGIPTNPNLLPALLGLSASYRADPMADTPLKSQFDCGVDRDFLNDPPDAGARYPQARATPRYPIIAQAQIYEPLSGARVEGRTTEIGVNGCYLKVVETFPRNTIIELRMGRNGQQFRTWARVAYVNEKAGIGLAFLDTLAKDRQTILDWIRELKP